MYTEEPASAVAIDEGGFTLVEMLVALSLLAVIAVQMSSAFTVTNRSVDLVRRLEGENIGPAVADYIRHQFDALMPIYDLGEGHVYTGLFEGDKKHVQFVVHSDGRLEPPGLVVVSIGVTERGGEQKTTALREVRTDLREASPKPHYDGIVIDSIESFDIRYFGTIRGESMPSWHESWLVDDPLPHLVELTLVPIANASWQPQFVTVSLPVGR